MSDLAEKLMQQALTLSESERAGLAYSLLDSLPPSSEDWPSEQELDNILVRRSAELRDGKVAGIPAGKVIADLREKYA